MIAVSLGDGQGVSAKPRIIILEHLQVGAMVDGEVNQIGDGLSDSDGLVFQGLVPSLVADVKPVFGGILNDEFQCQDAIHITLRLVGKYHVEIRADPLFFHSLGDSAVATVEGSS